MRVALAVAVGYFLGRTKKMKAALMLAGAGATGRLPSSSRELVREGVKRLGDSGEVSKLAESVRGELADAAKNAAIAAASNRIDALTSRIEGTTEVLTKGAEGLTEGLTGVLAPEAEHADTEEPESGENTTQERETAGEHRHGPAAADRGDDDRAGDREDTNAPAGAPRRRSTTSRARSTSSRSSTARTRKAAQSKTTQPKARTSARSAASDDAPVRRTGR
ncbi:hypothetical protein ABI214_00855 [Prescottella soli]|uniref:Uncharacterized protein n=1 Tax=Prescottella soli TaxID=1543852 RepID=A0ABW9G099_9NOCA